VKVIVANTPKLLRVVDRIDKVCLPGDHIDFSLDYQIFFLVQDQGKFLAYGAIELLNDHWLLCGAGVLPEARGRGIQRLLIQARLKYAMANRADLPVHSYTIPMNSHSINNLIAEGFRSFAPVKPRYGKNTSYWIYQP